MALEIAVHVEPTSAAVPAVEYRWDADTDILTATIASTKKGEGMSGSVGVEGADASWLVFDVSGGVASLEIDTRLVADADATERTIHFRIGAARTIRAVRIATDIVLDIDDADHIAGVWLLNVPPFPTDQ